MISGEILPILEAIDFSTKTELLGKLRSMQNSAGNLPISEKRILNDMLGVAIQEVYSTLGKELMRFKHYLNYKKTRRNKENV